MDRFNRNIRCNVANCVHNCEGKHCCLDSVNITCGGVACTRCGDFTDIE